MQITTESINIVPARSSKSTTSTQEKNQHEHIHISFPDIEIFAGEDDQSTNGEITRTEGISANTGVEGSSLALAQDPPQTQQSFPSNAIPLSPTPNPHTLPPRQNKVPQISSFVSNNSNAIASSWGSSNMPLNDNELNDSTPYKMPMSKVDNERVSGSHSTMLGKLVGPLSLRRRTRPEVAQAASDNGTASSPPIPSNEPLNKLCQKKNLMDQSEAQSHPATQGELVELVHQQLHIGTEAEQMNMAMAACNLNGQENANVFVNQREMQAPYVRLRSQAAPASDERVRSSVSVPFSPLQDMDINELRFDKLAISSANPRADIETSEGEEYIHAKQGMRITPPIYSSSTNSDSDAQWSRRIDRLDRESEAKDVAHIPSYSPDPVGTGDGFEQFESGPSSRAGRALRGELAYDLSSAFQNLSLQPAWHSTLLNSSREGARPGRLVRPWWNGAILLLVLVLAYAIAKVELVCSSPMVAVQVVQAVLLLLGFVVVALAWRRLRSP